MRRILGCLVLGCWLLVQGVSAEGDLNPSQAAEGIRQRLFEAQVALMAGDLTSAPRVVEEANRLYQTTLNQPIASVAPRVDARIRGGLTQALDYARAGNIPAFAALRGQIWTGLLEGSEQIIFAAIPPNDTATATLWLPLRDFRASTRFSRPGADATLAVSRLVDGGVLPEVALNMVRADLFDTYQVQLNGSLSDADEAHAKKFTLRRAEEAGLATGYFEILAEAYREARGEAALTEARWYFTAMVEAAVASDDAAFVVARSHIDTALAGFRAVPLTEADLARRAGQFVRFIALIPVEYERGVRDGVITNDIEVQEALTFHEGALAAFGDLQAALAERDTQSTRQISELLTQALTQMRQVADPADLQATIDQVTQLLNTVMPAEWLNSTSGSDIDVILAVLDQMESAAAKGNYRQAESSRLEAYALLELGVEQRLRGFAPDMAVNIEGLFWQGTAERPGLALLLASEAPLKDIRATRNKVDTTLAEAQLRLDGARGMPAVVVGNAAIIVFREGLEAVLILASLLASLKTGEQRRYRRPLLIGAGLAFGATALTWWLATSLLNVLLPLGERLEAIVSLVAIAVLLLITNWFFHKAYWTEWMANSHSRKQQLVGGAVVVTIGQTLGLILLGFTSIYREGFESVLFLQSLVLESGIPIVLQGVGFGLLGAVVVGGITFGLQVWLPYKKMLILTGILITVVLFTMVGNTVHVMQSIGWLSITPIRGLYLPFWMGQWFGVFATWQGIAFQTAAAVFVIGSYFLAEYQNQLKRKQLRQAARG